MRTLTTRPVSQRWLLLLVMVVLELGLARVAWAQPRQERVLVLYSTRRDAQVVQVGERELPRVLDPTAAEGLDYYSEVIDRARFPDPEYQQAFREFLERKYRGKRFDVIIAMQDIAMEFLGGNRNDLFPGVPVVFFSSSLTPIRIPNSTGVVGGVNLGGTVDLALKLQPDLRNLFVVTGAGVDDAAFEAMARAQLQSHTSRLAITYLTGLLTKDLEARLAALPLHSAVYYLVVDQDGAGENVHPLEYLDRVVAASNAPVYSWVDSAMEHRVIGGNLKDQVAQMNAVARLAGRVLRGEDANAIPLTAPDLNIVEVNWRELRRWGISPSRVPPDAVVLYGDRSVWEQYKVYILGAAAIVLVQAALIAGLLFQRKRRQRAEADVRGSEAELQTSYGRLRDLAARLLNAQETERAHIARDLHDDIGQQVSLLAIDLDILGRTMGGQAAAEARDRTNSIARSIHDLSHRLYPAKLRLIGLVSAIEDLQAEYWQSGLAVTFTHDDVPATLPPNVTLCLYRIVQEALQNVVKYSGARRASVRLSREGETLVLTVIDDGVGFDLDAAWGHGLGLVSMGERAEAAGGAFAIHSAPGDGTRVDVLLPVAVLTERAAAEV